MTTIECPHCRKMFEIVAVRNRRTDGDRMTQATQRVLEYIANKSIGAELYCWEARAYCGDEYRRAIINALGYFARAGRIKRLYRGCYRRIS